MPMMPMMTMLRVFSPSLALVWRKSLILILVGKKSLILLWGNIFIADLVCGKDQPYLMGNIFPSPLNDIISVVGVSSVDGKAAALCEGLKRISLLCELPIGYSFDLEPTARMLAGVSFWHSSVLVVVVIDAETGIECLHNKGVFVPLTHDREALGRVVCEGVDDESMVVRGDRQSFGGVLKGDDAVVNVRLRHKALREGVIVAKTLHEQQIQLQNRIIVNIYCVSDLFYKILNQRFLMPMFYISVLFDLGIIKTYLFFQVLQQCLFRISKQDLNAFHLYSQYIMCVRKDDFFINKMLKIISNNM